MNSLREIVEFVGISGPVSERLFPLPGKAVLDPTMRNVGLVVTLLDNDQRTSMRTMMTGLQHLPPISLDASGLELVVDEDVAPKISVKPSTGIVIQTTLTLFRNGVVRPYESGNVVGAAGGIVQSPAVGPGFYQFVLARVGIPNTGITVLKRSFDVTSKAKPVTPPPPPPPPFKIVPPVITVKSNGDGSFVVNGSGFLHNTLVTIVVADNQLHQVSFQQTSTQDGKLVDLQTGKICGVPGAQISFSGQDGSIDPSNHHAIFSNFVTVTCPF